jgi:hypothetical protein
MRVNLPRRPEFLSEAIGWRRAFFFGSRRGTGFRFRFWGLGFFLRRFLFLFGPAWDVHAALQETSSLARHEHFLIMLVRFPGRAPPKRFAASRAKSDKHDDQAGDEAIIHEQSSPQPVRQSGTGVLGKNNHTQRR